MVDTALMPRAQPTAPVPSVEPTRRRFTIHEYHRMADAGILRERDPVELLDGEIVEMSPIGRRHMAIVDRLNRLFVRRLGDQVIVRVQGPIVLDDYSEPQPDLALLRFRSNFYADGHPRPPDVLLAIEVSDSSVSYDRTVKLPLYARKHVREVWLVDLKAEVIDVHRRPTVAGYREHQRFTRGRRISLAAFPRVHFRVADVLG